MPTRTLTEARILIIDDQETNLLVLERMLKHHGYPILKALKQPEQSVAVFREFEPDLVLLDLHMPGTDGFTILELLRQEIPVGGYLPIIMLTADIAPEHRSRAFALGAQDFLFKPIDKNELLMRMQNFLHTRFLHLDLVYEKERLEERVAERTSELKLAKQEILNLLARSSEYRDDMTGSHTLRVGKLSAELARAIGLRLEEAELIGHAARLHDIGKIGIPDHILLKPGKFTPEEFTIMKEHTQIGDHILRDSSFPVLQLAGLIALTHHEKWDGTGYPQGLLQKDIPLAGRIVSISDVYDALTHERPYKSAWSREEALAEIQRQSGKHFDPHLAEAFINMMNQLIDAG